jgi:DeoR/GlpR family transcriptional regulator of sugar metabolism
MNIDERRNKIETAVQSQGKVDIDSLVQKLKVSPMTIRRDLMFLEKNERLIRTHGGAVAAKGLTNETPYMNKENRHAGAKKSIALEAADLVPENSTIILDSGTTTLELARQLNDRNDITVITNDIYIAAELTTSSVNVIVSGGELQPHVGAMFGSHTQELLRSVHVDLFFLGAHAVDPIYGVTAPTLEKAYIKRLMNQVAEKTWLIADASKFNQKVFARACSLQDLQGIVTDSSLDTKAEAEYHETIIRADV